MGIVLGYIDIHMCLRLVALCNVREVRCLYIQNTTRTCLTVSNFAYTARIVLLHVVFMNWRSLNLLINGSRATHSSVREVIWALFKVTATIQEK